jgi:hypothetical protein
MAEFTISSLPLCDNQVEQANNLLSTLSIIGARSSIFGLVVPMGKPRYVKGIDPISHPKVFPISSAEVKSKLKNLPGMPFEDILVWLHLK